MYNNRNDKYRDTLLPMNMQSQHNCGDHLDLDVSYLAAGKVIDVPGMFTVNRLLLGVCPLAVVFTSVRVCLASWLTAGDSLLLQVFLQQPLPEGWQWEARAMVPGIQILPVVTLHHLSSKRTQIVSLLYLDHTD